MTNLAKYSATAVANAFIELAQRAGKTLTNMQLQKLVYIAFGYYAGFTHHRLFRDDIQAWNYGPVIPNLYHRLKIYGVGKVTVPLETDVPVIADSNEMQVIKGVWDAYGKYTAIQLSSLTHKEGTPWSYMWAKANGRKNVPIPFELIESHYETLISERTHVN